MCAEYGVDIVDEYGDWLMKIFMQQGRNEMAKKRHENLQYRSRPYQQSQNFILNELQ